MSAVLLTNIGSLVTNSREFGPEPVGEIRQAAFVIDSGRIAWVGQATAAPEADIAIDIGQRAIVPGFVDSHTHPVFAGDRSAEFAARMAGESYTAGGIRTTMVASRQAPDEVLAATIDRLATEMRRQGTTTFEAKSGYGFTPHDESRMLATARERTPETTYLGAHIVPPEFTDRPDEYVDLVCGSMLEACRPYAKWIDVFCERGAFDVDQARTILRAGANVGLGLRVHANQLGEGPGVQLACELGAASADHCTHLTDADVDALAESGVVATLLPGAEFSTRSSYPNARRLIDAGVTVALATDCNPGSSYTSSMPFCIALAVREMRMTPAEAVWAATAGGARALRRTDVGVLRQGARADFAVLNAPDYVHLAYRPGVPLVSATWVEGTKTTSM